MSMIEISNLNAAGNDLFADSESFLNELQDTDSNQVIGGNGYCGYGGYGGGYGGGRGGSGRGGSGRSGRGYGGGRGRSGRGRGGYGGGGSCYTAD
jgi:hypothetical protein